MKVMKFGGTSVGSPARIKSVAELITAPCSQRNLVVLSAMSGTTNTLVEISDYLHKGNREGAKETIGRLKSLYAGHIAALYESEKYKKEAEQYINGCFSLISNITKQLFTSVEEKIILAQGELISTHMMYYYLLEKGVKAVLLPALDFMRTDANGEPDSDAIKARLLPLIEAETDAELFITQGFICRNFHNEVDNLLRGGSDYTASLVGAAVQASEIQIWTDIDGMHNNDPRVVEGTSPVRHLNFDEAAELGYFGAKILQIGRAHV